MIKKIITISALTTAIFIANGCVRVQVPVAMAVTGKIVNTETKEPIPNAEIYFTDYPEIKVFSNEKGFFELPTHRETKWVPLLPMDFHPPQRNITIIGDDGYETNVVPPKQWEDIVIEVKKTNKK